MATKKTPIDTDHAQAKLAGTLIGAVIVSLLSSGVFNKVAGDDVKEVVKGRDTGTAFYLDALRAALETRFTGQDARMADLEKRLAGLLVARALTETPLPKFPALPPEPLPSFDVR